MENTFKILIFKILNIFQVQIESNKKGTSKCIYFANKKREQNHTIDILLGGPDYIFNIHQQWNFCLITYQIINYQFIYVFLLKYPVYSVMVMMNKLTRKLAKIPEEVREEIEPYFVERMPIINEDEHNISNIEDLDVNNAKKHLIKGLTVSF